MARKQKRKPLTVAKIAKTLGVSVHTVYRTVRVARERAADPMLPLHQLARLEGVSGSVASRIIGVLKHEGVPAIKKLAGPESERFVSLLLSASEEEVQKAIADSEEKRKKARSGVSARMSKAKA